MVDTLDEIVGVRGGVGHDDFTKGGEGGAGNGS